MAHLYHKLIILSDTNDTKGCPSLVVERMGRMIKLSWR